MRTRGFTLIELLVVIAIIAILMAMFSPTSFTFNLTPPADEGEDITFMRDGFPAKSHR